MPFERSEVHNFAAGPSPLPQPVLEEAAKGLLNYNGTGMGICELSHRSKEFEAIIFGAEGEHTLSLCGIIKLKTLVANLRKLLQIPDNYSVLFAQGGATTQFSSTLLNMLAYRRLQHRDTKSYETPIVDYVVTGTWSAKAYSEAQRLSLPSTPDAAPTARPRVAATTKPTKYTTLPKREEYSFSPDAALVYYCENETINGIEYPLDQSSPYAFPFDLIPEDVPLVGDYSSSFISRPIPNLERHAIIHAGVQKNLGPAGVTVIIVRNEYLVDTTEAMKLGGVPVVPIQNEYKILADNQSLYNTPPVFAIYVSAMVLDHLLGKGGIQYLEETNREKARLLYEALDEAESKGKARLVVREKDARSWMNVVWEMVEEGANEKFLKGADAKGFRQLKGHRSVGGKYPPLMLFIG